MGGQLEFMNITVYFKVVYIHLKQNVRRKKESNACLFQEKRILVKSLERSKKIDMGTKELLTLSLRSEPPA